MLRRLRGKGDAVLTLAMIGWIASAALVGGVGVTAELVGHPLPDVALPIFILGWVGVPIVVLLVGFACLAFSMAREAWRELRDTEEDDAS